MVNYEAYIIGFKSMDCDPKTISGRIKRIFRLCREDYTLARPDKGIFVIRVRRYDNSDDMNVYTSNQIYSLDGAESEMDRLLRNGFNDLELKRAYHKSSGKMDSEAEGVRPVETREILPSLSDRIAAGDYYQKRAA